MINHRGANKVLYVTTRIKITREKTKTYEKKHTIQKHTKKKTKKNESKNIIIL